MYASSVIVVGKVAFNLFFFDSDSGGLPICLLIRDGAMN